jgi:hypothetical protein
MTCATKYFGSHGNYPQRAAQYLAKNYRYGSTVLDMDLVNVMTACEPVCDVYRSRCRQVQTQVHMLP